MEATAPADDEDRDVLTRPAPAPTRTWGYGPHPDQIADVYLPDVASRAPVLAIHGGFWRPEYDRMHLRPLAAALAERGHPVVLAEYRRQPGHAQAMLDDVHAIAHRIHEALPEAGGQPVIALGHSAGGHLALWLAGQHDVPLLGGIVALAPVADLRHAHALELDGDAVAAFLGHHPDDAAHADPRHLPPQHHVVVLHGDRDRLVPLEVAEGYANAHDIPLVRLPQVGHFALIDPRSSAWPTVLAELDRIPAGAGIE